MGSCEASLRDTFGPLEVDTPATDLLTWAFEKGNNYDRTTVSLPSHRRQCQLPNLGQPLYFDADDASRSISAVQVEVSVRRLIAGLKTAGVGKGDCVVLHLFNTVSERQL